MNIFTAIAQLLMTVPRWFKAIGYFFTGGAFIKMLIGSVVRTTPQLLIQLLLFFGLTMAVNTLAVPAFRGLLVDSLAPLPATWVNWLAMTKIDQAFTVVLSALGIAAARKVRLRPVNPSLWT